MPQSYKGYIEKRKKRDRYILAGITVAVSLFIIYFLVYLTHVIYKNQLASLQNEKKQIEVRIGGLSEYEKTLGTISNYETLIKETHISAPIWEDVLTEISSAMPYGIWFDSIDLKYEENIGKCEIIGRALDKSEIVSWIKHLEESPQFKNVEIKYIVESEEEGKKITTFTITMQASKAG